MKRRKLKTILVKSIRKYMRIRILNLCVLSFHALINHKYIWRLIIIVELFFICFVILPQTENIKNVMLHKIYGQLKPVKTVERVCTLPNKYLKVPEIYTTYGEVDLDKICPTNNVWVTCNSSKCSLSLLVLQKYDDVICQYSEILFKTNEEFVYSKIRRFNKSFNLIYSDFAYVNCSVKNNVYWNDVVFGVRKLINTTKPSFSFYNVVLHNIGSISHDEFFYKFNETYAYIQDELNATILLAYNSPGTSIWDTLIPMVTGYSSDMLKTVSYFSPTIIKLVWETYRDNGFITAFNQMNLDHNVIEKTQNLTRKQPTDHYMKTYYAGKLARYRSENLTCEENKIKDYTEQILLSNQNHPKFIMNFDNNLEHKTKNDDLHLKNWIKKLHNSNILNNTILFLMSDNGRQINSANYTIREKLDRNLPFFAIILPKSFTEKFNSRFRALIKNANFLTTPYDIHATLLHLLEMQKQDQYFINTSVKSISLFSVEVPNTRNCDIIGIRLEYCSCIPY